MLKADLGEYFLWNAELVKVVAINEGHRSIYFEPVINEECPHCGEKKRYEVIESSPLFQENAQPIKTIK